MNFILVCGLLVDARELSVTQGTPGGAIEWGAAQVRRNKTKRVTHTHIHLTALFSGTTRVSRYLKGKTNLDFTEATDSEWQWHQLGHMQVCTSHQTDNHASTPPLSFYRPDALPATQPTASKHWRQLHQHGTLRTRACIPPKTRFSSRLYCKHWQTCSHCCMQQWPTRTAPLDGRCWESSWAYWRCAMATQHGRPTPTHKHSIALHKHSTALHSCTQAQHCFTLLHTSTALLYTPAHKHSTALHKHSTEMIT